MPPKESRRTISVGDIRPIEWLLILGAFATGGVVTLVAPSKFNVMAGGMTGFVLLSLVIRRIQQRLKGEAKAR